MIRSSGGTWILAIPLAAWAIGCRREERQFESAPPFGAERPPAQYGENAFDLAEGKRLYSFFNCKDCHAGGGGGIGPALMDDRWFYGFEPPHIFESISKGRPNGMPAFGAKVTEHQMWQLTAYVRSIGGLVPSSAATSRDDHMQFHLPENSRPSPKPYVLPPVDAGGGKS